MVSIKRATKAEPAMITCHTHQDDDRTAWARVGKCAKWGIDKLNIKNTRAVGK